jgi:hypothetical protein
MFLNDSYLKYKFPGLVTGKLSDFLGVFYFPLLLCLLFLVLHRFIDKSSNIKFSVGLLILAVALTDVIFISVKLSPAGNLLVTHFLELFVPSRIIMDPTDLVALLMNPITFYFGRSFIKR